MVCNIRSTVLVLAILTVGKMRYCSCESCTEGSYLDTRYNQCRMCQLLCNACSSSTRCTSCLDGYYFTNGYCYSCNIGCSECVSNSVCKVCNDGYYLSNGRCSQCGNRCKTCVDSNTCTSCLKRYYFDVSTCKECPHPCNMCDSAATCTTCNTGYYLKGTTCTQCHLPCNTCDTATSCTACNDGYYLRGTKCTQCPGHCASCNSETYCTACTTGYSLYNSLCCPQACSTCSSHNFCTSCKTGYFMDHGQCKPCSDRCEHCGEMNLCFDCKSEYRLMSGSCYTCPNDCYKCIGDNKCSSCSDSGYYVHNHACVKCPEQCLSCTSNTECTYCTKGFYGTNQCLQECSDKCKDKDCEISGHCKSCVDGMHGDNCNIECGQNCTRCDRNTGGCSSCEAGTYLNNYKCERCSASCTHCTSSRCTECVVGRWGGNCEEVCTKCKPGTPCRKSDGYCEQRCVDGMSGSGCTRRCSSQCLSCERYFSSRCTACVANKYGHKYITYYCNTDCPQNCFNSTCDDITGECTLGCIDGYHGKKCKCPQNCNCDNRDRCSSCKEGYGNVNKNCECTKDNCVGNDCSACTSLNYFVHDKTCCSCRVQVPNCEECITREYGGFIRCTKCKTGFFPPTNQMNCTKCPTNCKDSTCDPITGECTLGCKAGHWNTTCDDNCTHCSKCDQQNGTCTVCKQGKYSPKCSKTCSPTCKTIDHVLRCAINDGACIDGCHSTKVHGSHCQHSCSINCSDEQCDWQTAHCLHGCTDHHFGNVCNNTCSQTCSTPKTGSRCYDTKGTCVDGCEVGYYGETCENQCSPNCVDVACEQFTGSCQNGCRKHYEGNDCMMEVLNNKTDEFGVTTMIVGVGIGLVIAIIIAVGAIVFKAVWKRRIRRLNETGATVRRTEQRAVNVSLTNFPNQTDSIRQRNDDSEGVVYEQMDEETNVHPGKNIVVDDVPVNEATGQGSEYEQLKPRNTDETNYSGLDVQDKDNVTDMSYENLKIK